MSPEVSPNPPVVTKRKKKQRDKKHSSTSKINDFNVTNYSCFQGNLNSYPNIAFNDSCYTFPSYPMSNEPMSLPIYPSTYPSVHLPITIPYNTNTLANTTLKTQNSQLENTECMSLPVVNGDQNEETGPRRYSDPGLPNDSDSSCNSTDSHIIQKLTHQISILKDSNRKLNREVMELRMELNLLKQQHNKNFDREYEPGMISDMIREIREAARVREDALVARVKHMVEEKQFAMSQYHLASEKNRNHERLLKLEEQMKTLSINNSRSEDNISLPSTSIMEDNTGSARQVFELEREALLLRRELQDARAKKEETDQKMLQLDKRLTNLLRPKTSTLSETSDDGSKNSASIIDSLSVTTQSSIVSQSPHRITLSGPVTDL